MAGLRLTATRGRVPGCSLLAVPLLACTALFTGCTDQSEPADTTTSTPATSISITTTTVVATTSVVPSAPVLAIWPTSVKGFASPAAAARDFVSRVLKVNPRLSPYMAGDSLSGEIDVFIGEDLPSVPDVSKGTLLLRRVDQRGWFVMAAVNRFNTIKSPTDRASVPAGLLTVAGRARGFEGQIAIEAYLAADVGTTVTPALIDSTTAIAGAMETPEPYSVTLDLSGAKPGSVVVVLVRGGRGLEQDPGEFTAVPVVVKEAS